MVTLIEKKQIRDSTNFRLDLFAEFSYISPNLWSFV
jgi:hypothetical protein